MDIKEAEFTINNKYTSSYYSHIEAVFISGLIGPDYYNSLGCMQQNNMQFQLKCWVLSKKYKMYTSSVHIAKYGLHYCDRNKQKIVNCNSK